MTGWPVPDGAEGDPRLVRVFTSAVREGEQECPMHRALKAHPRIETTVTLRFKSPDFEDFPLEPVMRALDLIEHGKGDVAEAIDALSQAASGPGRGAGGSGCTRGWPSGPRWPSRTTWKQRLPPVRMPGVGQPTLVPVREEWVQQLDVGRLDEHGVRMYELCAWGRRYQSPDGLFRELRLPRFGTVGAEREPGEVAMAARVLARGSRARVPERGEGIFPQATTRGRPYLVEQGILPSWVRIVEVGCGDGSAVVLFEGDPDMALELYEGEAGAAFARPWTPRSAGPDGAVPAAALHRPAPTCGRSRDSLGWPMSRARGGLSRQPTCAATTTAPRRSN